MSFEPSLHGQIRMVGYLALGCMFLFLSGVLIAGHALVLREVKTVSVPLVARLSDLERREVTLREQVELSQIHVALRVGSLGEKLDAYVLPRETDLDRIVAVFDLMYDVLRRQGVVAEMSDIVIGDPFYMEDKGVSARPLEISFSAHEDGMRQILLLIRLAGLLTVGDTLTDGEMELLFRGTEDENPVGIIALEHFLSLDLLRYARDPRAHEDQLRKSFASPVFEQTFRAITQTSLLRDARRLFEGDFGRALDESKLWPIQFMTVQELMQERGGADGWYKLGLELLVWERNS